MLKFEAGDYNTMEPRPIDLNDYILTGGAGRGNQAVCRPPLVVCSAGDR